MDDDYSTTLVIGLSGMGKSRSIGPHIGLWSGWRDESGKTSDARRYSAMWAASSHGLQPRPADEAGAGGGV